MVIDILYDIVEDVRRYIVTLLKSKIPPSGILIGFNQGAIFRSFKVLEVGKIMKIRFNLQITVPSVIRMFVLGGDVRNTPDCGNILYKK